ncbi:MAG: AmmeMemoRadiSam system protein B [Candidatus Omnitrophica bacterium]|nr:AmmeMemoRadiSam system protein B [Candidatus Omnitrophota bacterium]
MIREPVVCGQFYPKQKEQIAEFILKFSSEKSTKVDAKGIILPHAGYMYSGEVAVKTVSCIASKKRVIILGPNHTGIGPDFAVWPKGKWKTPMGLAEIDEELAMDIISAGSLIKESYESHLEEHSIEVELPILQYFFSGFRFVPIACKQADIQYYREAARIIFEKIKKYKNEVLVVASTDLTHYEPDSSARKKDSYAIEAIINLDDDALLKTVKKYNISMCGTAPVSVFISCMKMYKASKVEVCLYKTSGDASHDFTSVVGYAGILAK